MVPKRRPRLRGASAICSAILVVASVLAGSAPRARADTGAPPIVTTKAPQAQVGVPMRATLAVTAGAAPYTFEIVAGALPVGLGLAVDGTLTGTPTQPGAFNFTVKVTDSSPASPSAVQSYQMVVQDRLDPSLDPDTLAVLDQQASAARRFALAQIGNVQTRLQALRSTSAGRCAGNERRAARTPAVASATPKGSTLPGPPPQPDTSFSLPLDNCRTLPDRATTIWTAGALNVGANRAPSGADTLRLDSQGVTLGGDIALQPNLAFGGGVGFARDDNPALAASGASSVATGTAVSGYVSYRPVERLYVDAVFGVGDIALDSSRAASYGAASGVRRGEQRFISVSAGRSFDAGGWEMVPYTRVDHVRAVLRPVTESGAGIEALSVSGESVPSLKWVAGASAATSISTPLGTLAPRTSFEYRRELERSDAASLRYADDPASASYSIVPTVIERDSATLGIGANLVLASRWSLGLNSTLSRSSASNWTRINAMLSRVF